jgi:hypothetical protein
VVRGGEWLVIETCLDMAQTSTRRRPSFPPRRRVDATLDGVSPARRISLEVWRWPWRSSMRLPSASATTLFAREAFPLSSLQLELTLTLADALALTLFHLQLRILSFLSPSIDFPCSPQFHSPPSDIGLAGITFMRASEQGEARKCVSRDIDKTARVSSRGRHVP